MKISQTTSSPSKKKKHAKENTIHKKGDETSYLYLMPNTTSFRLAIIIQIEKCSMQFPKEMNK